MEMQNLLNLFNFLNPDIFAFVYIFIFLIALFETTLAIGLFVPGSTIILISGAFASRGFFNLYFLILSAIAGAIIGDNINYYLGKRYGHIWLKKGIWFLKEKHFRRAEKFFAKHGAKSVFLGRFMPTIKEIVPFIAGTLKMKRKTFLLWNVLGAIGWGLEWVVAGYVFSQSLALTKAWLFKISITLTILFLLYVSFLLIKMLRPKNFFKNRVFNNKSFWRKILKK